MVPARGVLRRHPRRHAVSLRHAARETLGGTTLHYAGRDIDLGAAWERIAVRDAFRKWAGWDPVTDFSQDRFDEDMALKVEPSLPKGRPCVLCDYPPQAASLARLRPCNPPVAERWVDR